MIYLNYSEIPTRNISTVELEGIFREVSYLDSVSERKNDGSKKESLAALLLLAEVFKEMGIDASAISIIKDANGRPFLKGNKEIDLSLSHSDRFVACAVSTVGRVGVDIEKVPDNDRYERIGGRFLSDAERGIAKNAEDFARVWTRKEAYYKFIGKGSLAEVDSERAEEGNVESYAVEGEYFISVCFEKSENICKTPQKITIK